MLNKRRQRTHKMLTAGAVSSLALVGVALGPGLPILAAPDNEDSATRVVLDRVMHLESTTSGRDPSVSGDGSRIVFVAPSQSAGDTGALDTIWLRDRATGSLGELIPANPSLRPGASRSPVISRDGCTVVMVSELALDLFRDDDTGQRWDVYRTVLPGCPGEFAPGEWQLVSTNAVGEPIARDDVAPDQAPAVSGAGTTIVYARRAVPDGDERMTWTSLDVVDVTIPVGEPGRVVTAPGLPLELPPFSLAPVGQRDPAISDDGGFVAFTTDAVINASFDIDTLDETITATWPEGVAGATEAISPVTQVYRWNRSLNDDEGGETFRLVSATPGGLPAASSSGQPSMSADGSIVAFSSLARDLDAGASELPDLQNTFAAASQVYVADLDPPIEIVDGQAMPPAERSVQLISRTSDSFGLGSSTAPQLDAAANTVVFATTATNLTTGEERRISAAADAGDIVTANLVTGELTLTTRRVDGVASELGASNPAISAAARTVVFETISAARLLGPNGSAPSGQQIIAEDRFPAIDVTPVDVGTVSVGEPGPEWKTRIVNNGPGSFVPDSLTTSDPAFAISGGSCTASVAIPAGASCEIDVIFTPAAPGPAASAIALTESGFGARQAVIYFSGAGGTPTIVANPAGQNIGDAIVGTRASAGGAVILTNIGPYDEAIMPVLVGGANAGDFPITDDGCSNVTLTPGASCQVNVGFQPSDRGRRSALVNFSAQSGATSSGVVSGTGAFRPGIAVGPSVVEASEAVAIGGLGFPSGAIVSVGWTDSDQRIAVAVTDNGAFTVSLPVVAGGPTGMRTITVSDPVGRFEDVESTPVLVNAARRPVSLTPAVRRP